MAVVFPGETTGRTIFSTCVDITLHSMGNMAANCSMGAGGACGYGVEKWTNALAHIGKGHREQIIG